MSESTGTGRRWKIMTAVVVTVTMVVAAGIGSQLDDKLDAGPEHLLALAQPAVTSEAYFYQLGIGAEAGDDPAVVGRETYRAWEQSKTDAMVSELSVPDGPLFCSVREQQCLLSLFAAETADIDNALAQNQLLLERYRFFIQLQDYATLNELSVDTPMPRYQYLIKGARLVTLAGLRLARQHRYTEAIDLLLQHLYQLRHQLARQDTLIGKMVYVARVSESLDLLYLLTRQSGQPFAIVIPALTHDEKDFETAMAKEFNMLYQLNQSLDRRPDFFEQGGHAPGWWIRILFKPNISSNAIFPRYQQVIDFSRLDVGSLVSELSADHELDIDESWLRNPVGVILNRVASADYNEYVARLFYLDSKISLFNAAINSTDMESVTGQLQNPFYPD